MQTESRKAKGWWTARFRMQWPEGTEPLWHIDLLLSHRVVGPLLHKYYKEIALWRFHRRAARDPEGHQFSFTFYSTPGTAQRVFGSLKSDKLLEKMKQAGIIIQDIYDDPNRISLTCPEDTSDVNWLPPIRKSWPFYIMGVCQMWLSLITEISEGMSDQKKSSSLSKTVLFYHQVNEKIKTLWREQGYHPILHHLNAIFGYEPIFVREVNLRRF